MDQRRRSLRRLVILVGPMLVLPSCDEVPAQQSIGLSRADDGAGVKIHYSPCPSEKVLAVRVIIDHGEFVGDADDEIVWEVRSSEGSTTDSYIVGITPRDFRLTVPLDQPLPEGPVVAAIVETDRGASIVVRVPIPRLRQDAIMDVEGVFLTPVEFRQRAQSNC
jgi:hypothetical protein